MLHTLSHVLLATSTTWSHGLTGVSFFFEPLTLSIIVISVMLKRVKYQNLILKQLNPIMPSQVSIVYYLLSCAKLEQIAECNLRGESVHTTSNIPIPLIQKQF